MNQKTKQILIKVKQHIQAKQYQQALDQCEVLLMKNSKIFNAHMFSGFCYEKLNLDNKAQKAYLEAEDLDGNNIDVAKALYGLYSRLKKDASTKYLIRLVNHFKKVDKTKYIQYFKKLVKIYHDDTDLELINKMFTEMKKEEKEIHQDLLVLAEAYFRVGVQNQCFQLDVFAQMGQGRRVSPECKEHLDKILLEIVRYLKKVSKDFDIKPEQMSETIVYLKQCFPDSGIILYLCLLDGYMISHFECMEFLLNEIHALLSAFYQKAQTPYTNLNILNPEVFTVSMLLTYQYLRFLRQFFTANQATQGYISKLEIEQQNLYKQPLSEENKKIIASFILRQAVEISNSIDNPNVSERLKNFRSQASKYGGFLEQVLARLAMNVFKSYKQLNDMKNILKIRIANEPSNVFLLKYYYDYLIKIGKIFRVFDEQISINAILQNIIALDPTDTKYQIEQAWINFSSLVHQGTKDGIAQIQQKLMNIQKQNKFSDKDRAVLRKKILIVQIHLGINDNVFGLLEEILKLDPLNYKSLMSIGSFLISKGKYSQALTYLKRAFIIHQNDYHLNRYIYLSFMRIGKVSQAEYFTQRIYPGFASAFWTNHVYAIASINRRNYDLGQKYLTKSIEIFVSSKERQYLVSYEKIHERQDLSSPYLILQNKYKILDQYLTVPQNITQKICPLISNYYYKRSNIEIKKIRMWLQMGETLKILGRLSSSLKSLIDADQMCEKIINQNLSPEDAFVIVLVKKQLAAIEFYYKNFRDAEMILLRALQLHNKHDLKNRNNVEAEIYGLSFQINIEKLLIIMSSETSQTISSYIKSFKIPETNYTSMSYMKSFYQLKILCYFHSKTGAEECLAAVNKFLNSFGLDFNKIQQKQFSNIYYTLSADNKKLVQEAVQDLVVFGYISSKFHKSSVFKLQKQQLLSLLQLFPNNLILYILYGVMVDDLRSKVGAFLKCVQLDPQNPISLYFLANLYLEEGKYLPAIQLYLKGIESNPLDMKSYYGLSLCLMNMAIRGLNNIDEKIIKQCFDKVHSFLEYIRTINSTLQYHFIDFVKILFYQKNLTQFDKKLKIQSGLKSYKQLNQLDQVMQNHFFEELAKNVSYQNIWKKEGKQELIEGFAKRYGGQKLDGLRGILEKKIAELQSYLKDEGQNQTNREYLNQQIILILSIALKCELKQQTAEKILNLIEKALSETKQSTQNTNNQLITIKKSFFRLVSRLQTQIKQALIKKIEILLPDIQIFDLILDDSLRASETAYKRKLNFLIMKHPSNEFLKSRLEGYLLIKTKTQIVKPHTLNKQRFLTSEKQKSHGYKKLMGYYNDYSAWILFIRQNLNKDTTQKRLAYWLRHLQKNPILSQPKHLMYQKSIQLFAEIYVKYQLRYEKQEKSYSFILNNEDLLKIYKNLSLEFNLYTNLRGQNLQNALKESNHPLKVGLNYLYQIITKHRITKQILETFRNISTHIAESEYIKYFNLLWYICALNAQRNKDLPAFDRLSSLDEASERIELLSNPNQFFILISKSQLDSQPDRTDELLGELSAYTLDSLDSKKLACYFDLMLVYSKVESHPEDEDIYESFQQYISHTKEMGDVCLNSFLHYLNGLVSLRTNRGTLMLTPQQYSIQEFRRSILLNPVNGKIILEKLG